MGRLHRPTDGHVDLHRRKAGPPCVERRGEALKRETTMPRFRLRLATFGLLIVIIALAVALVVQQRRETALKARIQALEAEFDIERRVYKVESAGERTGYEYQLLILQKQIDELRSKIARPSVKGKDAGRAQTIETGEPVGPKS